MNKVLIVIGIIVVLAVGWMMLSKPNVNTMPVPASKTSTTTPSEMPSTIPTPSATAPTTPTATQPINAAAVTIKGYAFEPAQLTVKKGTTVTWTNQDVAKHTVTADQGAGPQSQFLGKDETYSYTFDSVGAFPYHCQPHPYMKANVTVTE